MLTTLTNDLLDLTAAQVGHRGARLAIQLEACCCCSCCTCIFVC